MNDDKLTLGQEAVLRAAVSWFGSAGPGSLLTVGGFAGTGKTFTIAHLPEWLPGVVIQFCAPTGKAAEQLRRKLPAGTAVRTIHSLLYHRVECERCGCGNCGELPGSLVPPQTCKKPVLNARGVPAEEATWLYDPAWQRAGTGEDGEPPAPAPGLLVADEASMINEIMFADLQRTGIPLIAVGDHGQLKPVKSGFSLMASPDLRLETIVRQRAGDPIIQMSAQARATGDISYGQQGPQAVKIYRSQWSWSLWAPGTMMVVARRKTRRANNLAIRAWQLGPAGAGEVIAAGEPVICLKNSRQAGVFNGETFIVDEVGQVQELSVMLRCGDRWLNAAIAQFGCEDTLTSRETPPGTVLFDYAYAITCHKAQGSEAERVIVVEENWPVRGRGDERQRWLYTAVTRARTELIVVGTS